MDNKKVLGISIAAVVVLVIAIIATSYAAFTAQLTGTKENKLTTGYVKMNCAETHFEIANTQAMTDAEGIAASDNVATCTLTSEMVGTMTVGYDVALFDVDANSPSDALTQNNVKIQVSKSIDSGATTYLAGTSATEGVLVSSLASSTGSYDESITAYKLDSATLTGNHSVLYSIKAWVAEDVGGSTTSSSNTTGVCSDPTKTTEAECEEAKEIWGTSQTQTQAGSSFDFKLKIGATQPTSS
ncbi:MAG: hypothetical protein ACI31R_01525 [Bacilli bacterium]